MGDAMSALAAYEELLGLGAKSAWAEVVAEMRSSFEERTGAFGPDDAWFDARGQAFWDDALTTQKFGRRAAGALGENVRAWASRFERAHRGLFRAHHEAGAIVVGDVWSGAAFVIDAPTDALASALEAASGDTAGEDQLFDGRVAGCADPFSVVLLPGAVFHRAEASAAIEAVVAEAKKKDLAKEDALDALLRMDRKLQSHARVKPTYAYRADLLEPRAI
ncbi:MAG: hypothetical protein ACRELY_02955 [Polyangiaceae bacterium]